ncbi:unnamed protein product, partial [Mesorhabditis belari]|uniref:Uncharacterized protein n=1 Tax=Mesorhabditis belari TaxID=2138241 RepID=A0AAF3FAA7_9BILA
MDVFLLTTFVHDKSLCPVFAWCLKNLFITHLAIYFIEIFIRDFAANGVFIDFFMENQKIVGKIFFAVAVVWGAQVIHWNMLMGISRLWCVLAVISFKKYLTSRMRLVISCVVWDIGQWIDRTDRVRLSRALFGVLMGSCACISSSSLIVDIGQWVKTRFLSGRKVTQRILVAQFMINMPKLLSCFLTIYGQVQAFILPTILPEIDLKLYWFLAQLGGVGYGINATIVVFICFPQARQRLRKIVYRKEKSSSRADQSLHTLQTKEIVTLY